MSVSPFSSQFKVLQSPQCLGLIYHRPILTLCSFRICIKIHQERSQEQSDVFSAAASQLSNSIHGNPSAFGSHCKAIFFAGKRGTLLGLAILFYFAVVRVLVAFWFCCCGLLQDFARLGLYTEIYKVMLNGTFTAQS